MTPLAWSDLPRLAETWGITLPPDALARLRDFWALLRDANQTTNLTRIVDEADFLDKHAADALWAAAHLPSGSVLDVGSGGGVPGIPLALLRGSPVALLESRARKTEFLTHAVHALGLDHVTVHTARAEAFGRDPQHRETYDVVVSRALAPTAVCLELQLPLTRLGGTAALLRGPQGAEDDRRAAPGVAARLGGGELREVSGELPSGAARRVLLITKATATPPRYPRREGVPSKRPLEPAGDDGPTDRV